MVALPRTPGNISDNMLMGAVNAFNGKTNCVWNQLTGEYEAVSAVAKQYKAKGMGSIVVAEETTERVPVVNMPPWNRAF